MFLYNSMWAWKPSSSATPHGIVLHAVGCPLENANTREMPASRDDFTLFDPNSYLWELDRNGCARAVACLESYPWIPEASARTELSSMSDDQVLEILRTAADWQTARGVSRVILPTPLVSDAGAPLDEFLRWLDLGAGLARELDRPALLSLGLSEVAIGASFGTVLDQITAREDAPGVYAFVETSRSSGSVAVSQEVARMLLMTSYFVGKRLGREVVINFADTFGLASLSVGALAFAGGYERKCRRLDFEHFEERDGGGAFPKFFALGTTAYYRPERDMQRLRDGRLLRLLNADRTAASTALFDALEAGRGAEDVPEWRESRGNVGAAKAHLIERMCSAADELTRIPDGPGKVAWTLDWLQDAERDVAYLNSRFENAPLDDDGRHVRAWRSAYESFVDEFGLV
ncbi:MAG: hypothetical protein ACYC6T_03545 [Thermoleophilia bacterium]